MATLTFPDPFTSTSSAITTTSTSTSTTAHPATSDPSTHPSSASSTRRIALSSPADLLHLRATALRAARARIDAHLPPGANVSTSGGAADGQRGDALRAGVERAVDGWLETLFRGVRAGVVVNGLADEDAVSWDASSGNKTHDSRSSSSDGASGTNANNDAFEAYDAPLAQSVVALHARIEALHAELATARAGGVADAAGAFREGFEGLDARLGERERDALAAAQAQARKSKDKGTGKRKRQSAGDDAEVEDEERMPNPLAARTGRVATVFDEAVRALDGLGGRLDEADGKAAEAERVAAYMRSGK